MRFEAGNRACKCKATQWLKKYCKKKGGRPSKRQEKIIMRRTDCAGYTY